MGHLVRWDRSATVWTSASVGQRVTEGVTLLDELGLPNVFAVPSLCDAFRHVTLLMQEGGPPPKLSRS